jgi:two-component system KDP operon response regulator KdpE
VLSRRQFRLLKLLLDADGRVLTHHDLLRAIWAGGADGATIGSLRQAIAELRRKIEPDPRRPRHILSQSRIGYRFERTPEYPTGRLL